MLAWLGLVMFCWVCRQVIQANRSWYTSPTILGVALVGILQIVKPH